ncbi:HAD family hydrolase [Clostridium vincentii]|uniref:Putative phosphatase YwpJ n=1 Tax=Clostridium vincentii TaxID=52704 RepID=A0A2T0BCJ6_9CLOT|nr:HAD family hydrolase [Clostridium vincentii]PRR81562.1 putative phosphatase YwpJ [Clostridium vincentii]
MILYISDLDGTLLTNAASISSISKNLINEALDNKINFTIATARTPATAVNILKDININLPVITMNGSTIYDMKTNKYLYYSTIDNKLLYPLQTLIKEEGIDAFIYCMEDNHLFVYHNKLTHPYQISFYNERNSTSYKTFIESCLPDDSQVLYFTIMDYENKVNSLYERIKDIEGLSITKYRDTYNKDIINLEIYHSSSSKGSAIKYLKNHFNFDKAVTFGDNLNDISMFQVSDECYAVENATDELKRIATNTIGSNTDDSVAHFIFEASQNLSKNC